MSIYDFSATLNNGTDQSLATYKGEVLLIVNTASQCGFTPQYKGLQELYAKYHDQGLEVLGFPCDQFGHQEPGNDDEIKSFCALRSDSHLSTKVCRSSTPSITIRDWKYSAFPATNSATRSPATMTRSSHFANSDLIHTSVQRSAGALRQVSRSGTGSTRLSLRPIRPPGARQR